MENRCHPDGGNAVTARSGDPELPAAALLTWFDGHARDLPWRRPGTTAWGILVSEVMSQQTPVARVAPRWSEWLGRWPTPADLAAAGADEVLRAWGGLGYPRRALRLRGAAAAILARHGGAVPADPAALRALPGVGDYTAAAVAAFAFGAAVPVVDVNVRRVLRRHRQGRPLPGAHRAADAPAVAALLPARDAARFSAALMELGAVVCVARGPDCARCPVAAGCRWRAAGRPGPSAAEAAAARRRVQRFEGTDRQVRGKLLKVLREADAPVAQEVLDAVWEDPVQRARALDSLLADGLAEQDGRGRFRLPR